jgi:hypothetical protein
VRGYHPLTPVPEAALQASLTARLAVVLDTASPDHDTLHFPAEVFLSLLAAATDTVTHDAVEVQADAENRYDNLDPFAAHLRAAAEDERLPPLRVLILHRRQLVIMEETEFWAFCGGPAPYGDSFTASFYTEPATAERLEQAIAAACARLRISIDARIQGADRPVPTWRRRLAGILPGRLGPSRPRSD